MPVPTYAPGYIYRVPPGSTDLEDLDAHYHALVAVHPQRGSATLLFGTTSSTDSECGSPAILVKAADQKLPKATYFYATALVVSAQTRLGHARDDIRARLPEVRAAIKEAIGFRTGPLYEKPRGTESLREEIVEVTDKYESRYHTRFFAILTKHGYSAQRRYQVLAPLYDEKPQIQRGPVASIPMPLALRHFFSEDATHLYAPAELVRSLWHDKGIRGVTDRTLDAPFLEKIEDALCAHLSL